MDNSLSDSCENINPINLSPEKKSHKRGHRTTKSFSLLQPGNENPVIKFEK